MILPEQAEGEPLEDSSLAQTTQIISVPIHLLQGDIGNRAVEASRYPTSNKLIPINAEKVGKIRLAERSKDMYSLIKELGNNKLFADIDDDTRLIQFNLWAGTISMLPNNKIRQEFFNDTESGPLRYPAGANLEQKAIHDQTLNKLIDLLLKQWQDYKVYIKATGQNFKEYEKSALDRAKDQYVLRLNKTAHRLTVNSNLNNLNELEKDFFGTNYTEPTQIPKEKLNKLISVLGRLDPKNKIPEPNTIKKGLIFLGYEKADQTQANINDSNLRSLYMLLQKYYSL